MTDNCRLERFFTRVMWRIKEDLSVKECKLVQIPELKTFPSPEFTIYRYFEFFLIFYPWLIFVLVTLVITTKAKQMISTNGHQ
jgi:hypothetical protein